MTQRLQDTRPVQDKPLPQEYRGQPIQGQVQCQGEPERGSASFYYPSQQDWQVPVAGPQDDPSQVSHVFTPSFFRGPRADAPGELLSKHDAGRPGRLHSDCRLSETNCSLNMATAITNLGQGSMYSGPISSPQVWRISEHSFSAIRQDESEVSESDLAERDLLSSRVDQLMRPSSCQEFGKPSLADPFLLQKKSPFQLKGLNSNCDMPHEHTITNIYKEISSKTQSLHYPLDDQPRQGLTKLETGDKQKK